jgi:hypothetical protein
LPGAGPFIKHEHVIANAGLDRSHGNQIAAGRFSSSVEPIHDQEPPIIVIRVFDR